MLTAREGVRLQPYNDSKGYCTTGIGHLIAHRRCTPADIQQWTLPNKQAAIDLFRKDLVTYETAVLESVKVPLTDNQFDALVSLCYNIGVNGFKSSKAVTARLNTGDYEGAASGFMAWNKPPEIIGRRRGEMNQFRTPYGNQQPAIAKVANDPRMVRQPSHKFAKAEWLHPIFRIRLEALYDQVPFTNKSGGRSRQRQAELYNDFKAGRGNPANRPGTSWHEYDEDGSTLAQAADIHPKPGKSYAQMQAAAKNLGLHFPVSKEAWHVQPIEAGNSSRVAGQGLGPVPAYWNPEPLEDEEDEEMIRYGLIAVQGQGAHGVYAVPERTEASGRTLQPGELAKIGFTNGNILDAMRNAGYVRGDVVFMSQEEFDRIPLVANV
jgi:GH24 family phage-related lysozyme (muramidase)